MRKLRWGLLEQLEQLETEQHQIAGAIVEVHRRLYTLAQIKTWSLPGGGQLSTSSEKNMVHLSQGHYKNDDYN